MLVTIGVLAGTVGVLAAGVSAAWISDDEPIEVILTSDAGTGDDAGDGEGSDTGSDTGSTGGVSNDSDDPVGGIVGGSDDSGDGAGGGEQPGGAGDLDSGGGDAGDLGNAVAVQTSTTVPTTTSLAALAAPPASTPTSIPPPTSTPTSIPPPTPTPTSIPPPTPTATPTSAPTSTPTPPGCTVGRKSDTDCDGASDPDERTFGSDPTDSASRPEDRVWDAQSGENSCGDRADNDLDGRTDSADPGCQGWSVVVKNSVEDIGRFACCGRDDVGAPRATSAWIWAAFCLGSRGRGVHMLWRCMPSLDTHGGQRIALRFLHSKSDFADAVYEALPRTVAGRFSSGAGR